MTSEVNVNYLLFPTSKDIWEQIKQVLSKGEGEAEIYKVISQASAVTQENDIIYQFLKGLNYIYDQTMAQILGRGKIPNLIEVIAIMKNEES
ncbi:unnamed protein product [Spirodela intermedia]|uniref:Uncharacterized protein n=2 Tax=Spirodela intermedia TaxID=51605 RepID=A0ABN7EB86_SPIIN|nr:unnamed protein product [Spirodela intermedia]CAA7409248.1 unnamed protein product [Spirodela intermedia]